MPVTIVRVPAQVSAKVGSSSARSSAESATGRVCSASVGVWVKRPILTIPWSICSQTQGHPAAVWAHLGFPQTVPAAVDRGHLLLNALKAGPRSVQMLSSLLGISEHGLLDMAEPLLNRGAIIELENGELLGLPLGA